MLILLFLLTILTLTIGVFTYFRTKHSREGLVLGSAAVYLKAMNLTSSPHCSENWTFCNPSSGSMCCPLSNGICCPNSLTCCPQGTACSRDGLSCTKL